MNAKFNATNRKALAAAIGDILGEKTRYAGMPSAAYQISEYTLHRDGTLEGPDDLDKNVGLIAQLIMQGFRPEEPADEATEAAPEDESANANAPEPEEESSPEPAIDGVCIEFPRAGMTDEAIENLHRMVAAKAPLIKMALGIDELPIEVLDDRLAFDWFAADNDNSQIDCWAQFIACLCKTAMAKKRVTAQEREFTNPRYQMRCFLLALGMIGSDFAATRRLLIANLPGNSGWLNGPPEKAPAPQGETPAAAPEAEETADVDLGEAPAEKSEVGENA